MSENKLFLRALCWLLIAVSFVHGADVDRILQQQVNQNTQAGSLRRLRGGLKGRQKRNANRNKPRMQSHFHDDDDFTRNGNGNYYDDDLTYTTTTRKGSRSGKKKGKKHQSHNYDDAYYTDTDDVQNTLGLTFDDDDCEMVSLEDTFTLPPATFFLAPDTTSTEEGTPTLPGTVFLWDDEIVQSATAGNSTTISGTCTRTSSKLGGICNFVFVDSIEDISITVAGFLKNPNGGALAITGGTGDLFANIGQMKLTPVYDDNVSAGNDVFLDSTAYDVEMSLGIIVCPDSGD